MFRITPEEADYVISSWKNLPKGWTLNSVKKFWKSLTGKQEHKITKCIEKMQGKISNPEAFCASLSRKVGYTYGSTDMTFKITAREKRLILRRRAKAIAYNSNDPKSSQFLIKTIQTAIQQIEGIADSLNSVRLKPYASKAYGRDWTEILNATANCKTSLEKGKDFLDEIYERLN